MFFHQFRSFYTIHARHFNIHQHNIAGIDFKIGNNIAAIGPGACASKTIGMVQQEFKCFPQVFIVFKNGYPYQKLNFYKGSKFKTQGNSEIG
jgi:hypothetical protein